MENIVFSKVSKKFDNKLVLKEINLTISSNQVYCILGKNGAGKSTLINIACNIINPDFGSIIFNNLSCSDVSIKKQTGLLSQFNTLIEDLNAYDYLNFIGKIYKMNKKDVEKQIQLLTSYFFDDEAELKKPIKSYSTGMQKKVKICAAFIHKPKYLFLDEPFVNIDPIAANALCKLIKAYKNNERVIIIASHDLLYVNKVATNIGIIDNGILIFNDLLEHFRNDTSIDEDLMRYLNPNVDNDIILNQFLK